MKITREQHILWISSDDHPETDELRRKSLPWKVPLGQ
jgi:hypothetical protein